MESEGLIVVDDIPEPPQQPVAESSNAGAGVNADSVYAQPSRPTRPSASTTRLGPHVGRESTDRTTRSTFTRSKPQPKLKLKLSEKAAAQAPGMSFLGSYDRELDSDDEDLAFEEQFVLRMPLGEDYDKLRKMVAARQVSNDVWFKFKGAHTHAVIAISRVLSAGRQILDERCFTSATRLIRPNL
jgi:transcription initiation factor TFIID subunit 7